MKSGPKKMHRPMSRRRLWLNLGVLLALGGVALVLGSFPAAGPDAASPGGLRGAEAARQAQLRDLAWKKVLPRVYAASGQSAVEVENAVAVVNAFFEERSRGADRFAQDVLSLGGKWKFVHDRLPFIESQEHGRFVLGSFARNVFSSDDLRKVVELAVRTYLAKAAGIENRLLVDIRADVADLPAVNAALPPSEAAFRREYDRLAGEIAGQVAGEVGIDAGRLVGSEIVATIAANVMTAVATRLGVSAGLLSAGASASWASFGLTVVAGIVVDLGIDWAGKQAGHDPQAEVAAKVRAALERVRGQVIDGDHGLRDELNTLDQTRAKVRLKVLQRLILGHR
jgi:hypothetical protein